jgi:hypothetical protein
MKPWRKPAPYLTDSVLVKYADHVTSVYFVRGM